MATRLELKTPAQLDTMRTAGLLVAEVLARLREAAVPGVTTGELDRLAYTAITGAGAQPSFLGYHGFPASTCISVDAEVVHGIPRDDRVLQAGQIVKIDCGAIVDGWHGDAAITVYVGGADAVAEPVRRLVDTTERALWAGIAAVQPGARLGDVGAAIERVVRAQDYGILDGYTGHGIGTAMHLPPDVENVSRGRNWRLRLEPGLVIAIEPMTTLGSAEVHELDDGWTVVTDDGLPGAHWEHTVAVTESGPWVLTAPDGGVRRLGDRASQHAPGPGHVVAG
jgi:methionyl aminopeptidase